MDAVFSLPEAARAIFLQSLVQASGCSYICLWSYDSLLYNRLLCLDGLFNVRINQPSTSLGSSVAQRLFDQYRSLAFDVNDNDRIPGLAFKNRSYLELRQPGLLRLAWTQIQTQFYQEARIKTAVFMGCNNGEMELGFSDMSQDDIQTALRNWFPDEFSRWQSSSSNQQAANIDQSQNPPSSSSSSLRSLSLSAGSPEYSSLLFNIPGSSPHFPQDHQSLTVSSSSSHQQAIQSLAQVTAQSSFPTPQSENDAIMRAILHVLSASNPPSSSSAPLHHQNLPNYMVHPHDGTGAFKRYSPIIPPPPSSQMGPADQLRRQSLFKRSLTFFRGLNFMRMRERSQTTRPATSTQLHHMISERRRREKLNENFQALRSLLPPGTKKDKASILTTAKEVLSSLREETEKLRERNRQLEAATSSSSMAAPPAVKEASDDDHEIVNERLNVRIISREPESSSSEERMADLEVTVRGQSSQVDILIRLLGFLKQDQNLSLISMEANSHLAHATSFNRITVRLRIEGGEWDESAFQEAVRRVVGDLAQ